MHLSLRPVCPDDAEFLFQVYAGTRAEEMAIVPWNEEQKQSFLQMQFKAQKYSYEQQSPRAEYNVILHNENPAGRLIVDRASDRIRIIDIALLPEYRNKGIGSALIKDLQAEGQEKGMPVQLHVENFNRARRLYERLGFRKIDEAGFYWLMEWHPIRERRDSTNDRQAVAL